jgi:hypothetical protein
VVWLRARSAATVAALWGATIGEMKALAESDESFPLHSVGSHPYGVRYYVCTDEVNRWFLEHNARTAPAARPQTASAAGNHDACASGSVFADRRKGRRS